MTYNIGLLTVNIKDKQHIETFLDDELLIQYDPKIRKNFQVLCDKLRRFLNKGRCASEDISNENDWVVGQIDKLLGDYIIKIEE